ncbi:MAG TPA: S8 family serine peptidase [Thermoanaerobaculia bacterium]|nr:S8 family serine peptidase [Thermoanaerobaculia bacterium]
MKRAAFAALLFVIPFTVFGASARRSVLVATRSEPRLAVRPLAAGVDVSSPEHKYMDLGIVKGFSADLTDDEISALSKSPDVLFIEDDKPRYAMRMGLEPRVKASSSTAQLTPYGISLVRAPQAWLGGRGATINVAVVDSGIDYNHPELKAAYQGGFNTFTQTNDAMDDNGHGTHCSGVIGAADNTIGVVGVAPLVHLWAAKVLDKNGSGKTSTVIAGVNWVVQKKAEVGGNWIISLSLGSCAPSTLESQAFDAAISAGILVFAAAGNHDPTQLDECSATNNNAYSVSYPAAYPGVTAVAAVDFTKTVADFSNFGPEVALAAPGVDVLSTFPVGTGSWSAVIPTGSAPVLASPVAGSAAGTFTGPYVFCNLGDVGDFPASVNGKIALIKRGTLTFHDKAMNAKKAGAIGVVIFNKDTSPINWTLIGKVDANGQPNAGCSDPTSAVYATCKDDPADVAFAWPVTLGIPLADGTALAAQTPAPLTLSYNANDDYAIESGTSMACPHAAGSAATVWSMAPNATAAQIKQALLSTAHDLGDPGVDQHYGAGLVDAEAAGKQIAPGAFGSGGSGTPVKGRQPGRRGH